MRVLLTGGTGFIGQHLTRRLLARGWEVTVLVRRPEGAAAQALGRWQARLARGDVVDRASMREPMRGVDLVVHNAAIYEYGADAALRQRMRKTNEDGTDNVLGLARELDVPRVAYVSTVLAWGDTGRGTADETTGRRAPPVSAYEKSKERAHEIALGHIQRGVPITIACPSVVVGPNDHSPWGYFLRMYLNRMMPPLAFAADNPITPVHVEDLAEGIARVAEAGKIGESYILGGETTTTREILARWASVPGGLRPWAFLPRGLAAFTFAPMAPLLRALGLPAFISAETVRAGCMSLNYSSARAQRELGWTARSMADTWKDILEREQALQARRRSESLVARLQPVEVPDS